MALEEIKRFAAQKASRGRETIVIKKPKVAEPPPKIKKIYKESPSISRE